MILCELLRRQRPVAIIFGREYQTEGQSRSAPLWCSARVAAVSASGEGPSTPAVVVVVSCFMRDATRVYGNAGLEFGTKKREKEKDEK